MVTALLFVLPLLTAFLAAASMHLTNHRAPLDRSLPLLTPVRADVLVRPCAQPALSQDDECCVSSISVVRLRLLNPLRQGLQWHDRARIVPSRLNSREMNFRTACVPIRVSAMCVRIYELKSSRFNLYVL